jgi:hypothetical protein
MRSNIAISAKLLVVRLYLAVNNFPVLRYFIKESLSILSPEHSRASGK